MAGHSPGDWLSGRALGSHPRGHWFESSIAHHFLVPVLLAACAAAFGLAAAPVRAADFNSLGLSATYEVAATLDEDGGLLVDTTAVVSNRRPWTVSTLAFNLSTLRTGRAEVIETTVDGAAVEAIVDDQTLLVPLSEPLAPDGRVVVRIVSTARLNSAPRSGTDEWGFADSAGIVTLYRWIPWLTRTTPFDRPSVGDPFVTASSPSVRVTLDAHRDDLLFATSGTESAHSGSSWTFEARDVRDFNVTASAAYSVATRSVAGTEISFFHRTLAPEPVLDVAARAFTRFSDRIGPYPHATLNIAEIGPWAALESPSLFWLPENAPGRLLPWMTAHEMAHQWFYSVVGNDQAREPFADEAITDFIARDLIGRFVRSQCPPGRLDSTIYEMGECYAWVVYVQGDDFMRRLRERIGNERFWPRLAAYYAGHRFGLGGTRELLGALGWNPGSGPDGAQEILFPRLVVPPVPCLPRR